MSQAAQDLPFHPLADLFPLIEGAEFDELVQSIKTDGQIEPIILLDGAILDGRNRYRACRAAAVEPRVELFHGADPVRFVICKNIQRRHLNTAQRAALAAQFCTLAKGQHPSSVAPQMKQADAAKLFDIATSTITAAKVIMERGTDEEKALLRDGEIALEPTAIAIRQGVEPEERKAARERPNKGQSEKRVQTQAMQGEIWRQLRGAVEALTSLPLPADVVAIARSFDKRHGGPITKRLNPAVEWLMEFSDAWNARNG